MQTDDIVNLILTLEDDAERDDVFLRLLSDPARSGISDDELKVALTHFYHGETVLDIFFKHSTIDILRDDEPANAAAYKIIWLAYKAGYQFNADQTLLSILYQKIDNELSDSRLKKISPLTTLLALIALDDISQFLKTQPESEFKTLRKMMMVDISNELNGFNDKVLAKLHSAQVAAATRLQESGLLHQLMHKSITANKKKVYESIKNLPFEVNPQETQKEYMVSHALQQIKSIQTLALNLNDYGNKKSQPNNKK